MKRADPREIAKGLTTNASALRKVGYLRPTSKGWPLDETGQQVRVILEEGNG